MTVSRVDGRCDVTPLEELTNALRDCNIDLEEMGGVEGHNVLSPVANQIHSLMDCAPIKSTGKHKTVRLLATGDGDYCVLDYVVVNFHWVAAGRRLSTPR